MIPHLQMLRNQKVYELEAREQMRTNEWISHMSNLPSAQIYSTLQEMLPSLDYVTVAALRAAYNVAVAREWQIGISQAGENRAQEAHTSNMSMADIQRMIMKLQLP